MLKRLTLIVVLTAPLFGTLQAAETAQALPPYSTEFDESRDPFKDGAAAIELAGQTNRKILIDLGGDWCVWCHKMDAFFDANPDIKQRLHQTFVLLKISVSETNPNSEFLQTFPKPLGYPHMYVSDKNGSVLWSQDTAEFLKNGQYNRDAFITFFDRWQTQNE